MKKIAANFALAGSLLMAAAVLAPLFHSIDKGQSLGLWMDQAGRANLATDEVVTRAHLSTGLVVQDAGAVTRFCGQGGQITNLLCDSLLPYVTQD